MTTDQHPEQEMLMAWKDGELSGADDARVRAHMDACVACRDFVGSLGVLGEKLGGWQVEPATFNAPRPRPFVSTRVGWTIAASIALALAAGVIMFVARPPAPVNNAGSSARSTVMVEVFGDWLCPTCEVTYPEFVQMAAQFNEARPRAVTLVWRDYPLDATCNPYVGRTLHPGACDAAMAVRMARPQGREATLIAQLRSGEVTPADLKTQLTVNDSNLTLIVDKDRVRDDIARDIADAHARNLQATPSVYVDGKQIVGESGVDLAAIRAAIQQGVQTLTPNRRGGGGGGGRRQRPPSDMR